MDRRELTGLGELIYQRPQRTVSDLRASSAMSSGWVGKACSSFQKTSSAGSPVSAGGPSLFELKSPLALTGYFWTRPRCMRCMACGGIVGWRSCLQQQ